MPAKLNNKYFSDRQESMIANYLGWGQITGSGSRPAAPGDVKSSHWLGECKTHDTERSNIVFMKCHWLKIIGESAAKGRYPVLFVDNGTQRAENTWVMISIRIIDPSIVNIIEGLKNRATKGNSLNFDLAETAALYKSQAINNKVNVFTLSWEGRDLAVLPLSAFREFIEENF